MQKKTFIITLCILIMHSAFSEELKSMEFIAQDISDILMVFAQEMNCSILPDETVSGRTTFHFSDLTVKDAFDFFLEQNSLFSENRNNVTTVSRIKCIYDDELDSLDIKSDDIQLETVIKAISKKIGKTILYDTLPSAKITLDVKQASPQKALEICMKKFSEYSLEDDDGVYYIRKKSSSDAKQETKNCITFSGGLFNADIGKASLESVMTELFSKAGREYSFFLEKNTDLENIHFHDKDFDTMLYLLSEQGNITCMERDGIFYFTDLPKNHNMSKFSQMETVRLRYVTAAELSALIPKKNISQSVAFDKTANTVLLYGTREENDRIKSFIEKADSKPENAGYRKIDLKFIQSRDAVPLIPKNIAPIPPQQIEGTNSILITGSEESMNNIEEFIKKIDTKKKGYPVRLKYLKTEEFLKNIPPSISREEIVDSGFPNMIFYTGSEENMNMLMAELELIDKPKPQIKYQLLVIQYTKNNSSAFKPSIGFAETDEDPDFVFSGDLSNIMSLNFDVISNFGYQFAGLLNAQIANNTANIFTDTTLTGLSGQEIKFQNTDTYRYMEYDYDKTSGNTTASTTQQITSGLIVGLNGWISGDSMITMNVNATISKQNGDGTSLGETTGLTALPSTSERVVSTQVRTESGKPVIISGLIKDDENKTESRIPILSRIPLLGRFFRQTSKSREKTEIAIYIVPHLITGTEDRENSMKKTYEILKARKCRSGNRK